MTDTIMPSNYRSPGLFAVTSGDDGVRGGQMRFLIAMILWR